LNSELPSFLVLGGAPVPLEAYLVVAAILFCLGLVSCAARRNAIGILIGIELILNATNLNLLAFWRFSGAAMSGANAFDGPVFAVFIIILAACEAAVALGIVINLFYNYGTVEVDSIRKMHN
jgi:NADH:ubiquinone oxidoreductase subunit K